VLSAVPGAGDGARHTRALDPIITMNAGGIIQSASDSVEQVFGWTPAELHGRNVKVLIPEPRRSALDRYLDRYRLADRSKATHRTRRFDAMRKDGSAIQIELSMSRADLPMYCAPYFIGIIRDISREIDVSSHSSGERSRLRDLITEQTRALATAHLRLYLADRLASLGTLAVGLGHDINNVLLPIRARLDALEHTGMTAAARGHVTAVRHSISYLQNLSDGLHFLALDPDERTSDQAGSTSLAHWWSQVGPLLRKALPRHVVLRASLSVRLPEVRITTIRLTQAILNLIVNAGEAIPEGSRRALVRIWASAAKDGRTVRLGVTDTGRGMAPGVQRRAFDMFFTTKARGMGTGMGLPLARKVVERAGGSIELISKPGSGTKVVLTLPAMTRGATGADVSSPEKRTACVSVRDHRAAALISQILIGAGALVMSADVGALAKSNLWVTEPTPGALGAAQRWRRRRNERVVVLLGAPPKHTRKRWAAIGAMVIHPPDDFEAIRHILGTAVAAGPGNSTEEAHP
jgi:PAS domain S-box-containing protein